jgi:predicted RNase H-like nuclease
MTGQTTFIGVDLAWKSDRNHTGIAVLRGDRGLAQLVAVSEPIRALAEVVEFIDRHVGSQSVIAVDAPLMIENASGQRACERAVGKRYGGREASCHTSNRKLYPNAGSVSLAEQLVARGFVHAPAATATSDRVVLEVYPHAGLVAIFDLPKTIKYKKGTLAQKRTGLGILTGYLKHLCSATPSIEPNEMLSALLSRDVRQLPGAELKMHEDRLDALFCAYLAYYFWYWRLDGVEFFGDIESGYIANPLLLRDGLRAVAPHYPLQRTVASWPAAEGRVRPRKTT